MENSSGGSAPQDSSTSFNVVYIHYADGIHGECRKWLKQKKQQRRSVRFPGDVDLPSSLDPG